MNEKKFTNAVSKAKVRTRRAIDMERKMNIINKYESGQKLTSIAREFNLAASTVKTILKDRERIIGHVASTTSLKSTVITKKRAGAISEMEKLLTLWINDQMENNVPLSLNMIQTKARSLFEDSKMKLGDWDAKFVASNGWFHRYKARASIPNMKLSGDVANEQVKTAESYPSVLKKIIEVGDYTMQQIYNVGQTELWWKKMPGRDNRSREVIPEDRMTVLLGCNASGDHKLKLFSLIHSSLLPELEKTSKTDVSLHYRPVSDLQMTVELFEDWFLNCFIPDVEKCCRENNIPIKGLLILNGNSCRLTHLNNFYPNVKVVFLPPNSTALLEPVNQGLVSTLKCLYMRETLQQATDEIGKYQSLGEFWKSFQVSDAIRSVIKAWTEVNETCMNSAWEKLCPQFVKNKVESNKYCEAVMNEIVELSKRLEQDFKATDIDEFLNKSSTNIINTQLVRKVVAKLAGDKPLQREGQFDLVEMTTAFREIASALARFQKLDSDSSRFLKVKNGVEKALACYRKILEKNKGINEHLSCDDCIGEVDDCLTPASSQQCTSSAAAQDTLIVSINPDDVMLISTSSESSDCE